jgi:hypothetical protein
MVLDRFIETADLLHDDSFVRINHWSFRWGGSVLFFFAVSKAFRAPLPVSFEDQATTADLGCVLHPQWQRNVWSARHICADDRANMGTCPAKIMRYWLLLGSASAL